MSYEMFRLTGPRLTRLTASIPHSPQRIRINTPNPPASKHPRLTVKDESHNKTDITSLDVLVLALRPERDRGGDETPWFG